MSGLGASELPLRAPTNAPICTSPDGAEGNVAGLEASAKAKRPAMLIGSGPDTPSESGVSNELKGPKNPRHSLRWPESCAEDETHVEVEIERGKPASSERETARDPAREEPSRD